MNWNPEEAIAYYKQQGAPADQNALISLLREVQQEHGGRIPQYLLPVLAAGLGARESLLSAIIRQIPSLRLADTHCLEICSGPNCSRQKAIADLAESLFRSKGITVKYVPCMRMCGKGPNLRWDGKLHHRVDEHLLRSFLEQLD